MLSEIREQVTAFVKCRSKVANAVSRAVRVFNVWERLGVATRGNWTYSL